MKYSLFNCQLDLTDKLSVIYNSYTDKFVFAPKHSYSDMRPSDISANIAKAFSNAGIYVTADKDEVADYLCEARKVENNAAYSRLIINPTINCNFKCWYCYEKHYPSQMLPKTIEAVNKYISKELRLRKVFHLSFFGGEPLLYFKSVVEPILNFSQKTAQQTNAMLAVDFTSNGYLLTDTIIENLSKLQNISFQITLDGGRAEHDKTRFVSKTKGSYYAITQNIAKLVKRGIGVTLRINCTDANIQSTQEIPTTFPLLTEAEKALISVDMQKVWQEDCDISAGIDAAIEKFNQYGFKASHNYWKGFCYGDLRNSAIVNYNGDVYKCTAVDFANSTRDGYLSDNGDIIWENDSLEKRLKSKFQNKPCMSCRILPICHGGCSKRAIKYTGTDYCLFNFDEAAKDKFIKDRLIFNINHNPNFHIHATKNQ